MLEWFEELPEACPPQDAFTPNQEKYYRLAENNPPEDKDFHSQRKCAQHAVFKGVPECIACSVSIWKDKERCLNIKKLPRHKNKSVVELTLNREDGLLLQTFKPQHYSWWRSRSFVAEMHNVIG